MRREALQVDLKLNVISGTGFLEIVVYLLTLIPVALHYTKF